MKWIPAMLVGVIITVIGVYSGEVHASSSPAWEGGPYNLQSMREVSRSSLAGLPCGGEEVFITVANYLHPQEACLYGAEGGVRVARFFNNQGTAITVISFPSESRFYEIRGLCDGVNACLYSQASDKMYVVRYLSFYSKDLLLYRNFTKLLERKFDPSVMVYYYNFTGGFGEYAVSQDDTAAQIGNLAVSKNGKWVAVEYANRGVLRINSLTDEARRVHPLNSRDKRYELAITNDGISITMTGWTPGVFIISVDTFCGDRLVQGSTPSYEPHVQRCKTTAASIPGVDTTATMGRPSFISSSLLYYRVEQRGGYYGVTVTPLTVQSGGYNYIALGDSFTSGEGELNDTFYASGTNTEENRCHVSKRSYPYLLPIVASYPDRPLNIACSGAVIRDIVGDDKYRGQQGGNSDYTSAKDHALTEGVPGIAPQLEFIQRYRPEKITLSAGGNDTGFMVKLKGCIGPGVCEWAKEGAVRGAVAKEIDQMYDRYREVVREIQRLSDGAELVLVGYPRVISPERSASCDVFLGSLLSYEERRFMDESIKRLNKVMRTAAESMNVPYASVEDAYGDEGLCYRTNSPAMNGLRLGGDIAPIGGLPTLKMFGSESFHPTARGHQLVAQAISRSGVHARFGGVDSSDSYWGSVDETTPRYAALELAGEIVTSKRLVATVHGAGFPSGSSVSVWLQDTDEKKTVEVFEDGAIKLDLAMPEYEGSGHKVVYISGRTMTGEEVIGYAPFEHRAEGELVSTDQRDGVNSGHSSVVEAAVSTPAEGLSRAIAGRAVGPVIASMGNGVPILGASIAAPLDKEAKVQGGEVKFTEPRIWKYLFVAMAIGIGAAGVLVVWWISRRQR